MELIKGQEQRLKELVELVQDIAIPHKKYLSVRKFAQSIGWSTSHVRNLCETGKLKAMQPSGDGGQWKIMTSELARMRQLIKDQSVANHFNDHRVRKLANNA
ncbi:MAG: hypothetical protein JSS93_04225 [Bacteroidetes bacterium]|nr:hypothetical protein [Bacteroidota bacterium]MBS1981708.1 hypothetical protein [Bacteroidota bacterium]